MYRCILSYIITSTIIVIVNLSTLSWIAHPDIRTGYQQFVLGGTYSQSNLSITYNISYPPDDLETDPLNAGIGIVGFHTTMSNDFTINNTISSVSKTSILITFRVYGDTVYKQYAINWIVTGSNADFVEIKYNCHLCVNTSQGTDARSETFTGVTRFIGYASLSVNVYLSSFSLKNNNSLFHYVASSVTIQSGTNIIIYKFSVTENNALKDLCFTTLIFCQALTKQQYYDWGKTGIELLNFSKTPNISFPALSGSKHPTYSGMNRMFFGLNSFNLSRGTERQFNFNTTRYNSTNLLDSYYEFNSGTYGVNISYFWLAQRECPTNSPPIYFDVLDFSCDYDCAPASPPTHKTTPGLFCAHCHYSCLTCNGSLFDNCTKCDEFYNRELENSTCPCLVGFLDVGVPSCVLCQTLISGCIDCTTPNKCWSCKPGFVLMSFQCVCQPGFLVSGICTTITGCISAIQMNGVAICLQCNLTTHFQLNQNSCQCLNGYVRSLQLCVSQCGDGKKVIQEQCDDGNTINGDGCSSQCKVQNSWICLNGTASGPSICFNDEDFSMIVKSVRRINTANVMQVTLQVKPSLQKLTSLNFQKYITTNVPCYDFNATLVNNLLVLNFLYSESIQGKTFDIYLTLDPAYYYSKILHADLSAIGMNAKLTYDSYNSMNFPLEIAVIILDVLALIVMYLSCISERMIGIQMIQTLQIILFTQTGMKATPSSLSPLQVLKYSAGFNRLYNTDYTRTYTFTFSLSAVGLQKQFLLSFNLMFVVELVVIVICIILKSYLVYLQSRTQYISSVDQNFKRNKRLHKFTKIFNIIFERVLFLSVFVGMLLVVEALMLQMTTMQSTYYLVPVQLNLFGAFLATAVLLIMITAVVINGFFPETLIFPILLKQKYPPFYFIYQSIFISVLAFAYTQFYSLYVLGGMTFVFFIYNLIYQPYPQKFHNFILMFHQVVIGGALSIYIFENLTTPAQHEKQYKIACVSIISALYLIVALNLYRVIRYYKYLKERGWDQYGNTKQEIQNPDISSFNYRQLMSPGSRVHPINSKLFNYTEYGNPRFLEPQQLKKLANLEQFRMKIDDNQQTKRKFSHEIQDFDSEQMNTKQNSKKKSKNKASQQKMKSLEEQNYQNTNFYAGNYKGRAKPIQNFDYQYDKDGQISIRFKPPLKTKQAFNQYEERFSQQENQKESPYDESGFIKSSSKEKSKTLQDPLTKIKNKLKKDFHDKAKQSVVRQE